MVKMIDAKTISGKIAKKVFAEMLVAGGDPEAVVKEKGWVQVTDTSEIESWVDDAIAANTIAAADYAGGKDRALGSLVGDVMKRSRGKANPQIVNEHLRKKLRGD